jgi:hypothetical protein
LKRNQEIKAMKKRERIIVWAAFLISVLFLVGAFYFHQRADSIGSAVGNAQGKLVGTALGSFKGITEGIEAGASAGAATGLSAEDTVITSIQGTLNDIGNLEVLEAGVTLNVANRLGTAYASLSLISGNAVFSINLKDVHINIDGNVLSITLPEPNLEVNLDQSKFNTLAEVQHFDLATNSEDGLNNYLNSMKKVESNAKDAIANYDSLMDIAKQSAKKQVAELANAICGGQYTIDVTIPQG